MNNDIYIKLVEYGLIDSNQKLFIRYQKNMSIRLIKYEYLVIMSEEEGLYRLECLENDKYLSVYNNQFDNVDYQTNPVFLKYSLFFLFMDDISASIIPKFDYNQIVCIINDRLYLKKFLVCLNSDIITIFPYNYISNVQKKQPLDLMPSSTISNKIDRLPTNIITLEKLNPINNLSYNWLHIVGPSNLNLSNNLKKRHITYPSIQFTSIIYLKYILEYYDSFPKYILFLNKTPIYKRLINNKNCIYDIDKFILDSKKNMPKLIIDTRLSIEGKRIRYLSVDNKWGDWTNYNINQKNHQITIKLFWSYILKLNPNSSYFDYSENNTRLIPSEIIRKYSKQFYENLLIRLSSNIYMVKYIDVSWDTIFLL